MAAASASASAMLILLLLIPAVELSGAIRSPALHLARKPQSIPRFLEAPAFRNGEACAQQQQLEQQSLQKRRRHRRIGSVEPEPDICSGAATTAIHVAMTLDAAYLRGSMAAVLSIVQHAACPEDIVFHFVVEEAPPAESGAEDIPLAALVRRIFPYLRFKVYAFDEALVRHRISASVRPDLEQPLNYARNYLAELLPRCVTRVIYLDSDVVVVDDIGELWRTELRRGRIVGAPEYCHANFTSYFTPAFWGNATSAAVFRRRSSPPCYFNTGVMVLDLHAWRQSGATAQLEAWMELQRRQRIYTLGSLPPFLLVFAGDVEPIEHRWNQHGLGGDYVVGSCRPLHPGPVSLLHWSGKGKPWARLDAGAACPLDSLWAPYDLLDRRHSDA